MSREKDTLQVHYDRLIKEEKQYNSTIEAFKKDNDELKRTLSLKQRAIYSYIDQASEAKKELALVKNEAERIDKKLHNY